MSEPRETIRDEPLPVEDPWGGRNPAETVTFLIYNDAGRILRTGYCALRDLRLQAQPGETLMEGQANDRLQKVVDGVVVSKTAEEIAAQQRPPVPPEQERAFISQGQWAQLLARLEAAESRLARIESR